MGVDGLVHRLARLELLVSLRKQTRRVLDTSSLCHIGSYWFGVFVRPAILMPSEVGLYGLGEVGTVN